jgi:hypothetical protein
MNLESDFRNIDHILALGDCEVQLINFSHNVAQSVLVTC